MGKTIQAVDLFCGAGGTTTGLRAACERLGYKLKLLAINHWDVAIATHSLNHPDLEHLCASIDNVDPRQVVPSGKLDLLVASPECQHHSRARGGRPVSDQKRASAFHVLRWAESLDIRNILIENVPEFVEWGPIGTNNRPLKSRKGETFRSFIVILESLGYTVKYKILCAADYGDATIRKRLFIQARKGRQQIQWPKATHTQDTWRAIRPFIDFGLKGKSIFGRKTPLRPATLSKIYAGLERFGGVYAEPFLVVLRGTGTARSLDVPLPTVTAQGGHFGLVDVDPFIVRYQGSKGGKDLRVYSVDEPLRTIDTSNRFGLCQPFLIQYYSNGSGKEPRSIEKPLPTVPTRDRFGLVEPSGENYPDILFRMLQPHELAGAMSLDGYRFTGTKGDQVKQIGNAVPKRMARELCLSMLS